MNNIEKMAQRVVDRYGGRLPDVQDEADPYTQDRMIALLSAAGAPPYVAHYLSLCLSLGICAVMAQALPELKDAPLPVKERG